MFTGTAELYDALYGFKDYAREVAKIRTVIDAERPGARTILDIACGTGEHARHLAADFDVDGLDLDPAFVAIASRKHPRGRFHAADMRAFDLHQQYDVVLCLFSSIGYVLAADEAIATLTCFRQHLAPNGIVLVEPWFEPASYGTGRPHMLVVDRPDLKISRMHVSRREGDVSILDFEYLIATPDGVRRVTEMHRLLLVEHATMSTWFEAAGLRTSFDPVGPSGRGLFVARI